MNTFHPFVVGKNFFSASFRVRKKRKNPAKKKENKGMETVSKIILHLHTFSPSEHITISEIKSYEFTKSFPPAMSGTHGVG